MTTVSGNVVILGFLPFAMVASTTLSLFFSFSVSPAILVKGIAGIRHLRRQPVFKIGRCRHVVGPIGSIIQYLGTTETFSQCDVGSC
jgi:hypothetical protein